MFKKAVISRYHHSICQEELRKAVKNLRIVNAIAEIQAGHRFKYKINCKYFRGSVNTNELIWDMERSMILGFSILKYYILSWRHNITLTYLNMLKTSSLSLQTIWTDVWHGY
jgi:hypothetical protein